MATGKAAEIVQAHKAPQQLKFYSGYNFISKVLMLGGFVLLYREFGLPWKKGNCHINTRKSIHIRRRSPALSECCLIIAIISCNQPKRSRSGIALLKTFA